MLEIMTSSHKSIMEKAELKIHMLNLEQTNDSLWSFFPTDKIQIHSLNEIKDVSTTKNVKKPRNNHFCTPTHASIVKDWEK